MNYLEIKDLSVEVDQKTIINTLNLTIKEGETHVLMGPNGAGKSTLVNTIMGHPKYKVKDGTISFYGKDITEAPANERAKDGLFLSFQNPEEVPGITLENFMRTSKSAITDQSLKILPFHKELKEKMKGLNMDPEAMHRYLNVGFSGGEKKKSEILQMLTLDPKLAILDETDSGLDVDAVKIVSEGVHNYKKASNSLLIITHNTKILKELNVDFVHILVNGSIVKTGDASLVEEINANGFKDFIPTADEK